MIVSKNILTHEAWYSFLPEDAINPKGNFFGLCKTLYRLFGDASNWVCPYQANTNYKIWALSD